MQVQVVLLDEWVENTSLMSCSFFQTLTIEYNGTFLITITWQMHCKIPPPSTLQKGFRLVILYLIYRFNTYSVSWFRHVVGMKLGSQKTFLKETTLELPHITEKKLYTDHAYKHSTQLIYFCMHHLTTLITTDITRSKSYLGISNRTRNLIGWVRSQKH